MTFSQAVTVCFNKFANFNGRATRSEFWWFALFTYLLVGIPGWIAGATDSSVVAWIFGTLSTLFGLVTIIPSLAVTWRRLHDTGRAGGWFFICLIPLVGEIILIVWLAMAGQPGANRFGNPVR